MELLQFQNTIYKGNSHAAGLKFCVDHKGKMAGIYSLSTSPLQNPHCQARAKNGNLVCSKCYSLRQLKFQTKNFPDVLVKNGKILSEVIDEESLPTILNTKLRFESMGDLFCMNQMLNYIAICRKNPSVECALWTKNPRYIADALATGVEKPKNLQIVLSSERLNEPTTAHYDFVDKIFTVYTKDYIKANNIVINCAKNCDVCGLCYKANGVRYINEKVK